MATNFDEAMARHRIVRKDGTHRWRSSGNELCFVADGNGYEVWAELRHCFPADDASWIKMREHFTSAHVESWVGIQVCYGSVPDSVLFSPSIIVRFGDLLVTLGRNLRRTNGATERRDEIICKMVRECDVPLNIARLLVDS